MLAGESVAPATVLFSPIHAAQSIKLAAKAKARTRAARLEPFTAARL
jgi:hypothetical protein